MTIQSLIKNSTKQASWSDWGLIRGRFNVSVVASTIWNGTITLERKFGSTGTAVSVATFTTSAQNSTRIEPEDDVWYRIGCSTGDYTAGSANSRVSQ